MKFTKICCCFIALFYLSACTSTTKVKSDDLQWDFDHQLQYTQRVDAPNQYIIEVTPNKNLAFETISVFTLRYAYRLCQGYQFRLEVIQGIEPFLFRQSFPNAISPRFTAKITCTGLIN